MFPAHPRPHSRRGIIFIVALGVIIILTSLILVFAQNMRTESLASSNRLSYLQADAVEQGAERWVQANVEVNTSDATTITQVPANALQMDQGYFWLLNPNQDSDQTYAYGIVDESSKLNVNIATATQLAALPNMTDDIGASIVAWRGISTGQTAANTADSSTGSGATSTYYQTLAEPYTTKNSAFESLEELFFIKDITPQVMYGYDLNHDGVISQAEQAAGGAGTTLNGISNGSRGIADDLTVYSVQTSTAFKLATGGGAAGGAGNSLLSVLTNNLSGGAARANAIMTRIGGRNGLAPAFSTLSEFYTAAGLTQDELKSLAGKITARTGTTATGLVNANTASREVLAALFTSNSGSSVTSSDADSLITSRGGSGINVTTTGLGWVVDALGATKAASILDQLTSQSYQYSADIVAVAPNGRAFKRVRIVVDDRGGSAKIIFRKDLTSLGWPLSEDIRTSLRAGKSIAVDGANTDTTGASVTGS